MIQKQLSTTRWRRKYLFVAVQVLFHFSALLRVVLVVITSSTCCDITKTTRCLVCACFFRGLIPSVLCQRLESIAAAASFFPFTLNKTWQLCAVTRCLPHPRRLSFPTGSPPSSSRQDSSDKRLIFGSVFTSKVHKT